MVAAVRPKAVRVYNGCMSARESIQGLSVQQHAVELLLRAIYWKASDGLLHSFMYGRPGDRFRQYSMGVEIHYTRKGLMDAALYIRENAPKHIKTLPMAEIESRLMKFVSDYFWWIGEEVFGATFDCSFGEFVSPQVKFRLALAMGASELFTAREYLILYPIVTLRVEADFDSRPFFVIAPKHLAERIPEEMRPHVTDVEHFPPLTEFEGRRWVPASWLGVRASTEQASRKIASAVLGAIALTPHRLERYLFSGRTLFGGWFRLNPDNSASLHESEPHTPALFEDIVLCANDHSWLELLANKITSDASEDKRQLKALEYFYRAWGSTEVERFPILFMALDAIFGDSGRATQAVVDAIQPVMGPEYAYDRLRRLLSLRASVIHGGAPDVCESDNYHRYHVDFGENPISDLELIVARCFQSVIFAGLLKERPHTHAELIRERTGHIVQ